MDREETRNLIRSLENRIVVMNSALNGSYIECKYFGSNKEWSDTDPCWDWINNDYRVKPTKPRTGQLVSPYQDYKWEGIELTTEVREALEKAGISYAD